MTAPDRCPARDFIDLKSQYAALRDNIDARIRRVRIRRVLEHGQYVMSPDVGRLEADRAVDALAGAVA